MRQRCADLSFRGVAAARGGLVTCVSIALLTCAAPTLADILHLTSGRTVEGKILEHDESGYRVRTVTGIVKLPNTIVQSVEVCPSPFEQYEERRQQTPDTPQDQFALARWCEQRGLKTERRAHLRRALELDGDYTPARHALGFVRVGRLWVDGRALPRQPRRDEPARAAERELDEQQKLIAAIQSQWFQRIRAIRTALLEGPDQQAVENGRQKILQIKDPLAILPLARELSPGQRVSRLVLVQALSRFAHDEATMNLAVLALVDPDDDIRSDALAELRRRDDPRVPAQFREALKGEDWLVRRAAAALGTLRAREAVPELIEVLKAQRRKMVEVPVQGYFNRLPTVFGGGRQLVIGGNVSVVHFPTVGIAVGSSSPAAGVHNEWRLRDVTVFRTEALEALKLITGQNFGFEQADWRRWYQEQKP